MGNCWWIVAGIDVKFGNKSVSRSVLENFLHFRWCIIRMNIYVVEISLAKHLLSSVGDFYSNLDIKKIANQIMNLKIKSGFFWHEKCGWLQ